MSMSRSVHIVTATFQACHVRTETLNAYYIVPHTLFTPEMHTSSAPTLPPDPRHRAIHIRLQRILREEREDARALEHRPWARA
jgi:hypothetical protein